MVASEQQAAESADRGAVPRSVGRVLDLLEIVLARRSCNLTTAAADSGLTPTTARRHLRALEARGYVNRDGSGLFSAGPTLLRIAASLRDEGPLERLLDIAQPYLVELADRTGESAYLAISDGVVATYVATAESNRAIRHVGWVGQNVTLDGTAVGDALARPEMTAVRTGAVEPDITAVSRALPTEEFSVAVSIVGPRHRLDAKTRKQAAAELERISNELAVALGNTGIGPRAEVAS